MNQDPDAHLKRLFAQAARPGDDETFVATVVVEVAARRAVQRARRTARMALLSLAAVALALLLAPFAPPVAPVTELGTALLELPTQAGAMAETARSLPGAMYIGLALAMLVLPLAGAAWLARRS